MVSLQLLATSIFEADAKVGFLEGIFNWLVKALEDGAIEVFIALARFIGHISFYSSLLMIAVGLFCIYFKYFKILKIGIFTYFISLVLMAL